jgi:hypothetical protein
LLFTKSWNWYRFLVSRENNSIMCRSVMRTQLSGFLQTVGSTRACFRYSVAWSSWVHSEYLVGSIHSRNFQQTVFGVLPKNQQISDEVCQTKTKV